MVLLNIRIRSSNERAELHVPKTKYLSRKTYDGTAKNAFLRCYSSIAKTQQRKNGLWHLFARRLKWVLPVGACVSALAVWQWRHFKKYPHSTESSDEIFNEFVVKCYSCLPLRITSRFWGWIASREVPVSLRPTVYGFYAKTFHVDLDDIDLDLTLFPSLVEFFVRPLKHNARPIAQNTNIVSPADGTVLYFGAVTSCAVEQVKGITYNLSHFLGDKTPENEHPTKEENCAYINTLLKNPMNQLYQLTVYLAPGDYHRFHSPTDWEIDIRRHFQGKLLSVNPRVMKYLPDLFSLNERVVYIGRWAGGFMAYAAIGATNVGSIRVYRDQELITNKAKWPISKSWDNVKLDSIRVAKGEEFGEFRMGSTIVLLFEAPKDFESCLKVGQLIKTGEALCERAVKSKARSHQQII